MAAPRKAKSTDNATRRRLIEATARLMRDEGYAAATSRRVAAEAGVRQALVYYYFPTMDDLFVEVLKPLAEHAEKVGVLLLIEPEPELLLERTDQYVELADRVGSPALGLNFDVGHAYCMSEDLPKAIAALALYTRHYHLEDIAATRVHHHLPPGDGAIDFAEVIAAIRKTGYDGWLTVELYPSQEKPDEAARQAYNVLKPLI